MAWSKDHKTQSRHNILTAAASLFAQRGFENTSIDDVMSDAGMTRGAFYSHFKSKSDLYQEAMTFAALRRFRQSLEDTRDLKSGLDLTCMMENYLSQSHVTGEDGCPLAFLVTDVAHQDPAIRSTYTKLFGGLAERMSSASDKSREQILQTLVMMVGGVAIARALNDTELQQELLNAVKGGLQ